MPSASRAASPIGNGARQCSAITPMRDGCAARRKSIAAVTVDDMRGFVRDRFAKDVLLIGVVGDIAPEALKTLLDRTFGGLPDHAAPGTVPELRVKQESELLLAKLPIPQSVVVFGQPGLKRDDPDWYAALIVNHILGGGGFSSRLTQEVREKRGLAYSIYTALEPMVHGGVLAGGVATENARVGQSIALIRDEWKRMRDDGPTAARSLPTPRPTSPAPSRWASIRRAASPARWSAWRPTGSASTFSTAATGSSTG